MAAATEDARPISAGMRAQEDSKISLCADGHRDTPMSAKHYLVRMVRMLPRDGEPQECGQMSRPAQGGRHDGDRGRRQYATELGGGGFAKKFVIELCVILQLCHLLLFVRRALFAFDPLLMPSRKKTSKRWSTRYNSRGQKQRRIRNENPTNLGGILDSGESDTQGAHGSLLRFVGVAWDA